MAKARIYTGSSGINNKVPAHRLPFDAKTGVAGLEAAYNILIDRTGEVVTRRGTKQEQAGSFHSLYPFRDSFLVLQNHEPEGYSALYRGLIDVDGAVILHGIRDGLSLGSRMSFCEVDGLVYYMNGKQLGKTDGETSAPWPTSIPIKKTLEEVVPTFAGRHLDIIAGNFIFAKGNEVFWTEYNLWGLINVKSGRARFESKVLMVCAVQSGVYISDEYGIYFAQGQDPYKWKFRKVLNYPTVEFCREPGLIDPTNFGFETSQPSVLFGTARGPVIGFPDGTAVNLIDKAVTMPMDCGGSRSGMMVVDDSLIIQSNEA